MQLVLCVGCNFKLSLAEATTHLLTPSLQIVFDTHTPKKTQMSRAACCGVRGPHQSEWRTSFLYLWVTADGQTEGEGHRSQSQSGSDTSSQPPDVLTPFPCRTRWGWMELIEGEISHWSRDQNGPQLFRSDLTFLGWAVNVADYSLILWGKHLVLSVTAEHIVSCQSAQLKYSAWAAIIHTYIPVNLKFDYKGDQKAITKSEKTGSL